MKDYKPSEIVGDIYGEVLDLLANKADLFFEYRKENDNGDYPRNNRVLTDHLLELQKGIDIIYGIENNFIFEYDSRKLKYVHGKIIDLIEEKLSDITDENGNYTPRLYD